MWGQLLPLSLTYLTNIWVKPNFQIASLWESPYSHYTNTDCVLSSAAMCVSQVIVVRKIIDILLKEVLLSIWKYVHMWGMAAIDVRNAAVLHNLTANSNLGIHSSQYLSCMYWISRMTGRLRFLPYCFIAFKSFSFLLLLLILKSMTSIPDACSSTIFDCSKYAVQHGIWHIGQEMVAQSFAAGITLSGSSLVGSLLPVESIIFQV